MYNYEYLTKVDRAEKLEKLENIIRYVHNEIRSDLTFKHYYVGSSSRNTIMCDPFQNRGFDFDINLEIQKNKKDLTPEQIKTLFMNAFDDAVKVNNNNLFIYVAYNKPCEDSSRVFTLKNIDRNNSRIEHSADFCITRTRINKNGVELLEFIKNDKINKRYIWNLQPRDFKDLNKRIALVKKKQLWEDVRKIYSNKKNTNKDINKKSRSLFAEAVKEVYDTIK